MIIQTQQFLQNRSFLLKLLQYKVKEYYCSVSLLDFQTEKILSRLEGKIVSGSFNNAANSPTRRTGSFSLIFDKNEYKTKFNTIGIDKKIDFAVGIKNPMKHIADYADYGDILWFPQGIYIITDYSISVSTSSVTSSVKLIDKMGKLNGTCGGTIPSSVSLHDRIYIDKEGNEIVEYPLIKEIIFELVHHYGGEDPSRIIIEDIPNSGRMVVNYQGEQPIHIQKVKEDNQFGLQFQIGGEPPEGYSTYQKNNLIGYLETDLTYPGELIQKGGTVVTQVLDTLAKTLGNYEYFYDVYGNFHFRQNKNFQATGNTPLNFDVAGDYRLQNLYLPKYTDYQFLNEFSDMNLVTQFSTQPKFDNIKNDFICWGTKTSKANSSTTGLACYHLAIDERPKDSIEALCHKNIYEIRDENDQVTGYTTETDTKYLYASSLDSKFNTKEYQFNWREELYRRALITYGTSTEGSAYDEELLANWRDIYDPDNNDFKTEWEENFDKNLEPWYGYNPKVRIAPNKILYWLDLLDGSQFFNQFSVNKIGRRTKVIENSQTNEIFSKEIPDIVFIENTDNIEKLNENITYYRSIGQEFCIINSTIKSSFSFESSLSTCYEEIRSMFYNNLIYNTSINLTTIPIFYFDVNSIIRLNFADYGVIGDYVINSISWQIGSQMNTMSLQLNEAITII